MGKRKHLSSESKTSSEQVVKSESKVNIPKKIKVENHDNERPMKKKKSEKTLVSKSNSEGVSKKKKIKKEPVYVASPDDNVPYVGGDLAKTYKIKTEALDSPSKSQNSKTTAMNKTNTVHFSLSTTKIEDALSDSHSDSEEVQSDEVVASTSESDVDVMQIPKSDLELLLKHLEKSLPHNDNVMYKTRVKRIKWDQVKFGSYTAEQCSKMWENIYSRLRQFKTFGDYVRDAFVWLENPFQAFGKTKTHPGLPKRPKSAFFSYVADVKDDILNKHEGAKMSDITRIAAIQYRALTAEERQKYTDIAERSMQKYEEKMRQFCIDHPEMAKHTSKYAGPQRPLTPFSIFLANHLRKEAVDDTKDFKLAAKEVWSNLSSKKKAQWIRQALDAHNKYMAELELYNTEHSFINPIKPIKSVVTKEEKTLLDKVEGKPKKPPNSAYLLFSQKMYNHESFAELNTKDRMKQIAEKWRMLGTVEKAKYENKLRKMQLKYQEEYKKYLSNLPEYEKVKLETIEFNKKKHTEEKRRKSLTEKVTKQPSILPKNWSQLSEEEQKKYFTALEKINVFFEGNMGDISKVKDECGDDSEGEDREEDQFEEESEDDSSSDDD